MATSMATTAKGSWHVASGTAGQCSTALALPGSWKWYPANTILVRADQVANLPP